MLRTISDHLRIGDTARFPIGKLGDDAVYRHRFELVAFATLGGNGVNGVVCRRLADGLERTVSLEWWAHYRTEESTRPAIADGQREIHDAKIRAIRARRLADAIRDRQTDTTAPGYYVSARKGLSPNAQATAIDRERTARYREQDNDAWGADTVTEDATTIAGLLGVTFDDAGIAWSGFSSQGDGASFTGTWYRRDCRAEAVREYAPQDAALHAIAASLDALPAGTTATITRHGHHDCHAYSVRIDVYAGDGDANAGTDLDTATADALRAFMTWIYRQLETQYDYYTSDAGIREYFGDYTDIEFTATGTRHDGD